MSIEPLNPPLAAPAPPQAVGNLRVHGDGAACVLWIHGGGMFLRAAEYEDGFCSGLAVPLGATAVAVDYRLAPEHPYPAALHAVHAFDLLEPDAAISRAARKRRLEALRHSLRPAFRTW